jgi:hypothetical protein
MRKNLTIVAAAMLAATVFGCSSELTNNAAPVEFVVTNTQTLQRLDIAPNDDPDCDASVGTINMQVIPKGGASGDFVQVRVTRYRVSYQRTDNGRQVPAPFVRSVDTLIGAGESGSLTQFVILEASAVNQAPFAALLPQNGGRDPDTGQRTVKMDVIVELFGETLGGDNVYDSTRFPLDFCFDCGGCA